MSKRITSKMMDGEVERLLKNHRFITGRFCVWSPRLSKCNTQIGTCLVPVWKRVCICDSGDFSPQMISLGKEG